MYYITYYTYLSDKLKENFRSFPTFIHDAETNPYYLLE